MSRQVPIIALPDVTTVSIDYRWRPEIGVMEEERDLVFVRHVGRRWSRRVVFRASEEAAIDAPDATANAVIADHMQKLLKALQNIRPVLTIVPCISEAGGRARVEAEIVVREEPRLRLRSDSNCQDLVPWYVSDGVGLWVLDDPIAGLALLDLLDLPAEDPRRGHGMKPDLNLDEYPGSTGFDSMFSSFVEELGRLLVDLSLPTARVHAMMSPRIASLAWVDVQALEQRVELLVDTVGVPVSVREHAQDMLERIRS